MSFGTLVHPIFAAVDPAPVTVADLPQHPLNSLPGFHAMDILTIIAVTLVIMLLLVLWAIFIRKPKTDNVRTRVYKSRPREEETEDGMIRKRKKHKQRRRDHRTRNPTLSEAGGLPPMRSDNTPPPI